MTLAEAPRRDTSPSANTAAAPGRRVAHGRPLPEKAPLCKAGCKSSQLQGLHNASNYVTPLLAPADQQIRGGLNAALPLASADRSRLE